MHHVPARALTLPYVSLAPSITCLETFSRSSNCSLELICVDFPPSIRDSVSSSHFRPSSARWWESCELRMSWCWALFQEIPSRFLAFIPRAYAPLGHGRGPQPCHPRREASRERCRHRFALPQSLHIESDQSSNLRSGWRGWYAPLTWGRVALRLHGIVLAKHCSAKGTLGVLSRQGLNPALAKVL